MQPRSRSAILAVALLVPGFALAGPNQAIATFSAIESIEDGWEPLEFPNIDRHSRYELVQDNGVQVIKAQTSNSASGLIARVRLDPEQRPVLEWRWKVSGVYEQGDARNKSGDDYPARIYVAFEFEPDKAGFFERAKRKAMETLAGEELPGNALNYIWANKLPVGSVVPNPYTEATQMIAVNSGVSQAGEWVTISRNIVEDYKKAFGEAPPTIVGIAIMSDSDNTGETATAWYGDVTLSRQ
ncbi:MAG: DUF3047 domain-containing protein [Marinobacter sp.]|uniref:DUF3047 domain-containing protein n=1 Tax=Marinobacter sp. TaxID=50741 RepID=UPI0034A03341